MEAGQTFSKGLNLAPSLNGAYESAAVDAHLSVEDMFLDPGRQRVHFLWGIPRLPCVLTDLHGSPLHPAFVSSDSSPGFAGTTKVNSRPTLQKEED